MTDDTEFERLVARFGAMSEQEKMSPAGMRVFQRLIMVAPQWWRDGFFAMVEKEAPLPMPESRFRDDRGRALYSDQEIADHFGRPVEEVRAFIEGHVAEFGDELVVRADPDDLNPVQ